MSLKKLLVLLGMFFLVSVCDATSTDYASIINCKDSNYLNQNPQFILECAQKTLPSTPQKWNYIGKLESENYTKYSYELNSVKWPWNSSISEVITPTQWNNIIDIYIPRKTIKEGSAFVYIDSGDNYDKEGKPLSVSQVNPIFTGLLQQMGANTILVDIKDIPTQYLNINGVAKKEDAIIAYSWNKFINDPIHYIYHPLHLPMQVAVSQSMTLVQNELKNKLGIVINKFVISGTSKRGWTTWMVALADNRVVATIPMVIDILNTTKQLPHIFDSYGKHWPIALTDYYKESIPQYLDTTNPLYSNYLKLIKVEDPYSYLNNPKYKYKLKHLSNYVINSSGDDFFTPDASKYYFNDLLGSNTLLYVPNSSHNIGKSGFLSKLITSVSAYYNRIVSKHELPSIKWHSTKLEHSRKITVHVNELPTKAVLWVAHNKITRDFRYACNIKYTPIDVQINKVTKQISASYSLSNLGWNSGFLELDFKDGLTVSSQIYIDPDTYPSPEQIMTQQGACLII